METLTIEAPSIAAFATALERLPHETRATVTATESGVPWASVSVSPMTDTNRALFPLDLNGVRGDTAKRGQAGVRVSTFGLSQDRQHTLRVVVQRAMRMARA